jgi:hypothetical protein
VPLEPAAAAVPVPVAPLELAVPPERVGGAVMQIQSVGQSVETMQLVAFGWHEPGNVVIVMQVSGGSTGTGTAIAAAAPELGLEPASAGGAAPPSETVPVPVPPEPEHPLVTLGKQLKPAPQSVSVLHGSCHVNMHFETLVSVQPASTGSGFAQKALGGQSTGVPALQLVKVSVWHTMLGPHSVSAAQGAGSHEPLERGKRFVDGAGSETGQGAFAVHEGVAGVGVGANTHTKP